MKLSNSDWALSKHVEREIAKRLDRHVILEDQSVIEIEQLNGLLKVGNNAWLEKALNEILGV